MSTTSTMSNVCHARWQYVSRVLLSSTHWSRESAKQRCLLRRGMWRHSAPRASRRQNPVGKARYEGLNGEGPEDKRVSDLEPNAIDDGVPDEEQLDEGRQWEARRLPAVGDTHAGSGDPISGV